MRNQRRPGIVFISFSIARDSNRANRKQYSRDMNSESRERLVPETIIEIKIGIPGPQLPSLSK